MMEARYRSGDFETLMHVEEQYERGLLAGKSETALQTELVDYLANRLIPIRTTCISTF